MYKSEKIFSNCDSRICFYISTRSQLLNTYIFKEGAFIFSVGTFLEISIIGEVDLLIPALGYYATVPECEVYVDNTDSLSRELFNIKLFSKHNLNKTISHDILIFDCIDFREEQFNSLLNIALKEDTANKKQADRCMLIKILGFLERGSFMKL